MTKKLTEDDRMSTEAALVLGTKEVIVEQPTPKVYNSPSVKLQSLMDARLHYTGEVTKRQYVWDRAGSIMEVDSKDALYLLSKRIKTQSCCSGSSDVAVFQKID
jgi:hypothetical protein